MMFDTSKRRLTVILIKVLQQGTPNPSSKTNMGIAGMGLNSAAWPEIKQINR